MVKTPFIQKKIIFINFVILLIFTFELIRTAWISDDAGITIRTIINFMDGYGLRFNIDERGYYYQMYGLLSPDNHILDLEKRGLGIKRTEVMCGSIGFSGILGGASLHLIDICALTDPLLSRLPAKYDPNWRIGHFHRLIPAGYIESIELNQNVLLDKKLTSIMSLSEQLREIR